MEKILSENADLLLLTALIAGIIMVIWEDVCIFAYQVRLRYYLRKNRSLTELPGSEEYIDRLLKIAGAKHLTGRRFIQLTVASSIFVFVIMLAKSGLPAAVLWTAAVFVLPYGILRVVYENRRISIGNEGERLIKLLLSEYRIRNANMLEALERLGGNSRELPYTHRLVSEMVLKLRESGNIGEISSAAEIISKNTDKRWAGLLAMNIRIACCEGRNVAAGLEEILRQMTESRKLMEERLRLNNESIRMTVVMIPLSVLLTVGLSLTQMDIGLGELAANQFSDPLASMMFLIIMVLFAFNLSAGRLLSARSVDL